MKVEYPFLKATKPDRTQYTIELENVIDRHSREVCISIGRQNNNHIVLSDPQKKISRHYCLLQYRKNRCWIVDDSSANETFLQREIDRPEIDVQSEDAIASI